MSDYSELKRLAEAARSDNSRYGDADCYEPNFGLTVVETAFASAATPAAVLALIAENERLDHESQSLSDQLGSCDRERRQLKADVEALRKDAERYRWMRSSFVRNRKHSLVWYLPMMTPLTAEGLDENIDAAMSKGEQA